jgi:hypothetical protein
MTGNINWAQTDRGLTWVFNTDGASIKFYNTGDGDTDSRLEFATLDNNDEYFRWGHIPSGGSFYESMRLRPVSNGNAELIITGKIIKSGGTTSQFLKANGDVDSNSYYLASNPSAFITLTSLSNVAPIQYNNATGAISITQASGSTNGFLSSTDWNTFNNKTSNAGTVTSVAALTIGTSGTDLSSSVANGTTTPVITLNVPTASAANRGALSAADWTTFNGKQNALNGTGFVKANGTTISYDNTNYLPLTGGTLTGALGGTSASFSGNVSANDLSTSVSGLNVSGYGYLSQTISGQMTILGHNIRANSSVSNQVNVVNGGWISSMIKQYFSDGITFHTDSTVYSAGAVYPIASTERMRITPSGRVLINTPTEGTFTLDVNGTGRFIGNLTAASLIRSGGTSAQFLKADGSVDSNTYVTGGPYLPLTGGTLTGTLNGTTAVFSNTVTANQGTFTDGNQGLIIGYYTGGNGYGAIYASTLTINNSNYALIAKSDNTILNAPTGGSVNVSIGNTPRLTIASTGAATFSSSVTITDGQYYIYDTRTNLANRNWVLLSNAQFFGDFAIRQSNAKDGNPLTAGTDRFYIGPTGAATFSSSVTATSIIRSGGTSSQYLMADGSVSTLTNPVTGTGTTNYLPKFTGASTIGNSIVFDNGSSVGINTITPSLQGFNNELTISSGTSGTRRTALNLQGSRTVSSTFASIGFYHQANFVASIESSRGGADNSGNLQFFTTNAGVTGERMTIDPVGNLGLGVTPSAWTVNAKVIDINTKGAFWSGSGVDAAITGNAYYDSVGAKYKTTAAATDYWQIAGEHRWFTAPSGTAGNAISFTQAMTLGSNSGLSIGTPSAAPSQGLLVQGASIFNGNLSLENAVSPRVSVTGNTATGFPGYNLSNTTQAYEIIVRGNLSNAFQIRNTTVSADLLSIASTGAATFSSSVTAGGSVNINGSGARILIQDTNQGAAGFIAGRAASEVFLGNDGGLPLSFLVNSSERMRITAGGNVGIGTDSPASTVLLDLKEPDVATDLIIGLSAGTGARSQIRSIAQANATTSELSFHTVTASSTSERMRITSGGNVLIGKTTDRLRLTVSGSDSNAPTLGTASGTAIFANNAGSTEYGMNFGVASTGYGWIQQHRFDGASTVYALALQPSGGNVLIGTATDAGFKLDVNGTGRFSGVVLLNTSINFGAVTVGNSIFTTDSKFQHIRVSVENDLAIIRTDWFSGAGGAQRDLSLQYGLQERIRLNSTGISVTGAATFSSSVTATSYSLGTGNGRFQTSGFWGTLITAGTGSFSNFAIIDSATNGIMYNPTGTLNMSFVGSVGIGTAVSNNTLNIYNDNNAGISLQSSFTGTTANDGFYIGQLFQSTNFLFRQRENADIIFETNNGSNQPLRITSGGNVLIGTTANAGDLLSVAGNIRLTDGANRQIYIGSASNYYYRLRTDGDDFVITEAGVSDRLRYSYSTTRWIFSAAATFSSSVTAGGDVIAFSSSDRRLKDNITSIKNPLQKINKIGGYSFTWNSNQDTYSGNDYGVVAQEIEEIFPELVRNRDNGYKAVKYEKLIPLLIESIKELSKEVEILKQK